MRIKIIMPSGRAREKENVQHNGTHGRLWDLETQLSDSKIKGCPGTDRRREGRDARGTGTPLAVTEKSRLDGGFKGVTCIKLLRPHASAMVHPRPPVGSDRFQDTSNCAEEKESMSKTEPSLRNTEKGMSETPQSLWPRGQAPHAA